MSTDDIAPDLVIRHYLYCIKCDKTYDRCSTATCPVVQIHWHGDYVFAKQML